MNQDRRSFLATVLSGLSLPDLVAKSHAMIGPSGPDDEAYWKTLRKQFPLKENMIYLNNGALGPSPQPVIDAANKSMFEADEEVKYAGWEKTAKKIAAFVGADENEIALTRNVTEGVNIACWGLPLSKGDEVILTTHEHSGGALPWLNRQKLHGIVVRTFSPAPTADETLNRISSLINKRTKVIAIPHILCTQGQVMPVREVSKLGKEKGIFVIIDGAHGPGMMPLDLHEMGCDVYATCCHKWLLGPKGTGFLYVRKDFQDTLQTYFVGGGSDNSKWNMSEPKPQLYQYADNAHRYYGGTYNNGLYAGVGAAIDFMNGIGTATVASRTSYLTKYLQDQLLQMGNIDMLTPVEERSRCAMIGFRVRGVSSLGVYQKMLDKNIRIRSMVENSLDCLRVSTHIYNSPAEIDRFLDELKKV